MVKRRFPVLCRQIMEEGFEIIELSQLQLRYRHTRIRRNDAVLKMADSLQRYGQISPVGVVAEGDRQYVLIDGYLRAEAIRRCAKDTIKARILAKDLQTALIEILCQPRRWDAIEQAGILRELNCGMGLSQAKLASLVGRQQSWVSRRLSLLEVLSEDLCEAVFSAKISTWAACRVLVPMARANAAHAQKLVASLSDYALSTRDLARFYAHYKKANRKVRENMLGSPKLFLKALESQTEKRETKVVSGGPEGQWLSDMSVVSHILTRLIKNVAVVFYPDQKKLDQRALLTAFSEVRQFFLTLSERIDDEIAGASPEHCHAEPTGIGDPPDRKAAQYLPQHGARAAAG